MAGAVQGQLGHVEFLAMAGAAQAHELLPLDPQVVTAFAEIVPDHVLGEMVVAGGHGGVGGEYGVGRHRLQGGVEGQPALHLAADALQHQEGGVTLVDVKGRGLDPQGLQGAHAADAQDDLLLDAGVLVAAIELVGDVAVLRPVGGQVGIQQAEADVADAGLPDLHFHPAAGQLDEDVDLLALLVHRRMDGQVVEFGIGIGGDLVAVVVDALGEVALAVEQAHGHEGQAHVRRGLAMVAGQDAETAGIDGKALVQTKLGAEIGDRSPGFRSRDMSRRRGSLM
jgi:hypothetical protein